MPRPRCALQTEVHVFWLGVSKSSRLIGFCESHFYFVTFLVYSDAKSVLEMGQRVFRNRIRISVKILKIED